MKKYFIGILFVFCALVVVVKAQTTDNFSLTKYTRDLSVGISGIDVIDLQIYLMSNGFDIPAISSGAAQRGYFGSQTKKALAAFQSANGIPGTGYFGPLTRAKLNGNNPGKSLNVASPNGGEVWIRNSSQAITWSGSPGILDKSGSIKVVPRPPACADPANGPIRCMIAVRAPYVLADNISLFKKVMQWSSVGNYVVGDIWGEIPDGDYKIQICTNDGAVCDESDGYFTISTNGTTSKPPVINSIDAPTALIVGQTGTWTVRATDPQGGTLSYSVDWGDNHPMPDLSQCPAGYTCAPSATVSVQQSSTFTHVYSTIGEYHPIFTIRNTAGQTSQTSALVTVTNPVSKIPQVTSPNGGEMWTANTNQYLRWTTLGIDSNVKVDLYLDQANIYCITTPCGQTFLLDKNIPVNQLYYWIVATDINNIHIMPADYKFRVCLAGTTDQCDSSDKYFTIR